MADTTGKTPRPGTRKVTVGVLSGAVVAVLVSFASSAGVEISPEVVSAATTLVTAILVYTTSETFT